MGMQLSQCLCTHTSACQWQASKCSVTAGVGVLHGSELLCVELAHAHVWQVRSGHHIHTAAAAAVVVPPKSCSIHSCPSHRT
jgi:hypothetical protein